MTAKDAAREWWIKPAAFSNEEDLIFHEYGNGPDGLIHVIEYAAYEQAVRERDELRELIKGRTFDNALAEENARLKRECDGLSENLAVSNEGAVALEEKLAKARAALERVINPDELCGGWKEACQYARRIAREALREIE